MGRFFCIVFGTMLLLTLAIPFVNFVCVPIGLYLVISGIRQ
jgi:uncharacterized protein involved in cysteine biosynthesis